MNYKTRQPFPHAAYVEGQRNFTYFDRSLTSGLTDVVIESPGDFLYIDQASTGVVSVELNMRQGGTLAPILLAAGGSIECDFSSIKLTASAQLNKTARIVVGNGARIKGGANVNASSMSVSVVDGGLTRTIASQAFIGNVGSGPVAGQLPHCQLWNPPGSGKNLYLENLTVSTATTQVLSFARHTVALLNASAAALNKYLGSGVGVGLLKNETAVAAIYTAPSIGYFIAANTPFNVTLTEPILIPPGIGVIVFGGTNNTSIGAIYEWYEQ